MSSDTKMVKTDKTNAVVGIVSKSLFTLAQMLEEGETDCFTPEVMKGVCFGIISTLRARKDMTKKLWNELPEMTEEEMDTCQVALARSIAVVVKCTEEGITLREALKEDK